MIEVGDPLTPEQVRLFRVFAAKDFLADHEAASLALGLDPRTAKDQDIEPLTREIRYWGWNLCDFLPSEFELNKMPLGPGDFRDHDSYCALSRAALQVFFDSKSLYPAFLYREAWGGKRPECPLSAVEERDLHPKERASLHIIIAVLLHKVGIDPESRDAASKVARMIELAGARLHADTVREHIRAAAKTLEEKVE